MTLSDYDYQLPAELIAQTPMPNRSDARMLVVDRKTGTLQHRRVRDLPEYITPKDVLVLNNTQVLPARLIGTRSKTGGKWEGLFVRSALLWNVLSKTKGKITPGETVQLQTPEGGTGFDIEFIAKQDDGSWQVKPLTDAEPLTALRIVGSVPIPPYIRSGRMVPEDAENYQTVYASVPGAVAAPTAGLHFTPELLETLKRQGTAIVPVTLHVGIGTFKPITAENIDEHQMHPEWCTLSAESAETLTECRRNGGRIIAVGTTSVRVLESAAKTENAVSRSFGAFTGETALFIKPPYQFRNVDVLLTNFHFPKSTLLILVRTFGGEELLKAAYLEAIRQRYRFFSYGDAMLLV
ncbi:MAG: tRNA preQ1(34) S-adenosylmethionine ribosyltransferase-isomerase QueA [Planctomycetaceae bacterium]|jgi:S-adenosylmethionine:tRNA ribosyltransferase-isomerase|nr:tRNA preQ1(34) S-adenosylmethionine ribosyltransferase-isomerase QueA [Planctomycetaceae bacterium]